MWLALKCVLWQSVRPSHTFIKFMRLLFLNVSFELDRHSTNTDSNDADDGLSGRFLVSLLIDKKRTLTLTSSQHNSVPNVFHLRIL